MLSPARRPDVTLTFDLQNLTRLSVRANKYSLSVLSKLSTMSHAMFMRHRGNNICQDERMNERMQRRTTRKHNVLADTVGCMGEGSKTNVELTSTV